MMPNNAGCFLVFSPPVHVMQRGTFQLPCADMLEDVLLTSICEITEMISTESMAVQKQRAINIAHCKGMWCEAMTIHDYGYAL